MIDNDVEPAARAWLETIVPPLRAAIVGLEPRDAAEAVANVLRGHLPEPTILSPQQRLGSPNCYQQHIVHVEPDGSFSIVALVWRPGQRTPIHDHVCWCVVGVVDGVEAETRYELKEDGAERYLVPIDKRENPAGMVGGFAPPGDIHFVRNCCGQTVISLHVYGADIGKLGSSVRRSYAEAIDGSEVVRVPADVQFS